ncbi:MAG: protocatechuate 3,4-dioxygenase subunit alpha [Pseudomonadota bacterium]
MKRMKETPSQTAGPYVHIGCLPTTAGIEGLYAQDPGSEAINDPVGGTQITIQGTIFDGAGAPLTDAMVETWQADAAGLHAASSGWGRRACDTETGLWQLQTVKPGPVSHPGGATMAPHITLWLVARGINIGLHTRLYFDDEAEANAADPVLQQLGSRAKTLIARQVTPGRHHLDIYLQGPQETVFFDA